MGNVDNVAPLHIEAALQLNPVKIVHEPVWVLPRQQDRHLHPGKPAPAQQLEARTVASRASHARPTMSPQEREREHVRVRQQRRREKQRVCRG